MAKRLIAIVLMLVVTLLWAMPVTAEQYLPERAFDFAYDNASAMQFRERDRYTIRSAYRIALPKDTSGIHALIIEQYGACQDVYLIEYGYADIEPIVQSLYVCVGIQDGNMVLLETPFQIISKVYDYAVFSDVSITEIQYVRGIQ